MIELSGGDVFAILIGLAALIVGLVAFFRAHPNATPAALDTETARLLTERQKDREWVERLERAYQNNSATQQRMFDTFAAALRFIAPLTPIKSDDIAANLLTDIQQPGEPILPESKASA